MQTALRSVGRADSALRRLAAAWFLVNLGEWAYVTALMIDEYRRHGALAVGLIGARYVPGAVLGPGLLALLGRRAPQVLLRGLSVARFALIAGIAAAGAGEAPLAVIIALVWLDAVLTAPYRPVQSSLIPALANTPRELATVAGNVPASKALAQAGGALLGSLLLLIAGPGGVIGLCDIAFVIAAVLMTGVRAAPPLVLPPDGSEPRAGGNFRGIRLGFEMVARHARPLLILGGTRSLTRGLWTSMTVVVSLRLLHLGNSGVGILLAAAGAGAAIAIPVSLRLAGRRALANSCAISFALAGLPITLIGVLKLAVPTVVLVVIWGVALTLADSISNSLIHRVVDARDLSGSIAATESAKSLLEGIGALLAPLLLTLVGVREALIFAGAPLPVLALLSLRGLGAIDRRAQSRERPLAAVLRAPSFHGMTMLSVESIAARLAPQTAPPGTAIVTQGEMGDSFYLIDSGSVEVAIDGYRVAVLRAGGSFGEKALLRSMPRSASVNTLEPTSLWRLGGPDFVAAATGREGPVAAPQAPVTTGTLVQTLAAVALFGAIDHRELANQGRQIMVAAGARITAEGDPGDAFYALLEGLVEVTVNGAFVGTLQPGDTFGEIALLHSVPRSATVTARVDTTLWMLERTRFLAVLDGTLPASARGRAPAGDDVAGAGLLV